MAARLPCWLVMAFCAGASLALGVTSSQAASTRIRVWDPWPYYSNVFDKLMAEFHKTHPDINVEVSGMQESAYRAAVKSVLAAGTGSWKRTSWRMTDSRDGKAGREAFCFVYGLTLCPEWTDVVLPCIGSSGVISTEEEKGTLTPKFSGCRMWSISSIKSIAAESASRLGGERRKAAALVIRAD